MKIDNLDRLRVASPCPTSWDQMSGNERVRYCELCNLNVYNIAELTRKEATALVSGTEGHFCARLFRRSDGTVITRDCPVGLRAIRRRVARVSGAVFATVLAMCSAVLGQKPSKKNDSCKQQVTISRKQSDKEAGGFTGTVLDPNGALIVGARIRIVERNSKDSFDATGDNEGRFRIPVAASGTYALVVEQAGFQKLEISQLTIAPKETVILTLVLAPDAAITVLVGLIGLPPMIDTSRPGGTTIITREMIQRLPIPR